MPTLAYADFTKPFKMHTDARGASIGAVLYQTQEGKDKVIVSMNICMEIALKYIQIIMHLLTS